MVKKKIVAILLLIIMLFNVFSSTVFASLEENNIDESDNITQNEIIEDNTEDESNNNQNITEDTTEEVKEDTKDENTVEDIKTEETTNKIENTLENNNIINTDKEENTIKNEESATKEDYGISLLATQDIPLQTISSNTSFDPEYGFSFKFIDGKTTTETSGMTNNSVDYNMQTSGGSSDLKKDQYYSSRLTSNNQKGKIWCRYNNVGTYNGQIVDLKVTLSGWSYLQPANKKASSTIGGVNYPTVFFAKDKIEARVTTYPAIDSPVFTFNFYKHGTNTPISVKCVETFKDIDNGEYLAPTSGFDKIYKNSSSNMQSLSKSDSWYGCDYGTNSSTTDKKYWLTVLLSGSSFKFTYTRLQDKKGNDYRDITSTASSKTRSNYQFIISAESLAPFKATTPAKKVSKTEITGEEEFFYTIEQFIPAESSSFYYSEYTISDKIDDCLEIKDISVTDDGDVNRTGWFNITKDNNDVEIKAKSSTLKSSSFYNNNLYFKIDVIKKEGYDMSSYLKDNKCTVYNKATMKEIRTNGEDTIDTNTVKTDIYADISTNAINGTIDESMSKIPYGSSIKIEYGPRSGYGLVRVTVDGQDVDISKYPTFYTIENISKAHYDIEVEYQKLAKITILKVDEKESPLEGVSFKLTGEDGKEYTATTDKDGKVEFNDLTWQKYTLVETKTIAGFELSQKSYTFDVGYGDEIEYTIKNVRRTELPVTGGNGSMMFLAIGTGLILISFGIIIVSEIKKKTKENK